ncbi:unnamed protein product, partial [Amoebophrya sp. A25]
SNTKRALFGHGHKPHISLPMGGPPAPKPSMGASPVKKANPTSFGGS